MPGESENAGHRRRIQVTPPRRDEAPGATPGESRLMARVRERCHVHLAEACRYSSVAAEFLAALVANESGANPRARRFEPAVYGHLAAIAAGRAEKYGSLTLPRLDAELGEMLHPKSDAYHAAQLDAAFAATHAGEIAAARDEALRELATSWGYTQIMGYHMVGRAGTARDLLEPRFHFRIALELLAEFTQRYQLDARREFAELFRCWNTGQPYGATTDPAYVEKGLRRMEIYRGSESLMQ